MPGYLLGANAIVNCAHQGLAKPTQVNPRVRVAGQPVVPQPGPWTVAACTQPPPTAGNGPCVQASWLTGSLRVKANGLPLLLMDSKALAVPTGTPLTVKLAQPRVKGV